MRLLLVTQDFPPDRGGIQTYCHELALGLGRLGHEVRVICPDVGARHAADVELPVRRLHGPGSWLFLPWAARLRGLLRAHRPTHVLYGQWQLAVLARPGVPTGCLVHGRELLTSVFDPLTPWLLPRTFAHVDVAFPVSRHVEDLLRARAHPRRVARVAPGVDPVRFAPSPRRAELRQARGLGREHVVLLGLGRLAARKNFDRVVACMPALRAARPEVRLVLGGSGPLEAALRAQVDRLGVADVVQFLGDVPDAELPDAYALGDVFVLPSRGGLRDVEGFGIVFLEAAACGLPAVATRAGGIEDAVRDGETGLLVQADELEAALQRLVQDASLRARLGTSARARILAELTWDHTARGIERGLQGFSAEA